VIDGSAVEFAWEKYRGTRECEILMQTGSMTTIAINFCKYFLKSKGL
jgi:hypothetical protein